MPVFVFLSSFPAKNDVTTVKVPHSAEKLLSAISEKVNILHQI